MKIHYAFSDSTVRELDSKKIPLAVKMRFILNTAGFKFKDDGLLSSLTNLNPEPKGKFRTWRDEERLITHYEQEI